MRRRPRRYLHAVLAVSLAMLATLACAPGSRADAAVPDTTEFEPGSPTYEQLARRGFYRRRAQGVGWFATRREPVLGLSRRMAEVLGVVPGVTVVVRNGQTLALSSRDARGCPLAVFVDGSYTTIRNLREIDPEGLAAVEVYRGPSDVPVAFHVPAYERTCGALLVWSRLEVDD